MKKLINFINQMAGLSNAMDNELFVADSNGKILFVNNPVADLSGYSVNELKKLQLKDIDRKSTRLNPSHVSESRMPSSA